MALHVPNLGHDRSQPTMGMGDMLANDARLSIERAFSDFQVTLTNEQGTLAFIRGPEMPYHAIARFRDQAPIHAQPWTRAMMANGARWVWLIDRQVIASYGWHWLWARNTWLEVGKIRFELEPKRIMSMTRILSRNGTEVVRFVPDNWFSTHSLVNVLRPTPIEVVLFASMLLITTGGSGGGIAGAGAGAGVAGGGC